MTRHPAAAITGTVTRTHDAGTATLVDLHLAPHLRAHVIITGRNPRRAALHWHTGDTISAWGWGPLVDLTHPDPCQVIHAHTIQRHRPGRRTNLLDPARRLTPRQRNRRRLAEIIEREIRDAERDAHELDHLDRLRTGPGGGVAPRAAPAPGSRGAARAHEDQFPTRIPEPLRRPNP